MLELNFALVIFTILLLFTITISFRTMYLVIYKSPLKRNTKLNERKAKTLVVMGSGGHTGEMLGLLSALDFSKYFPRIYVVAETDVTSSNKVQQMERMRQMPHCEDAFTVLKIPRSREVHQSWRSTVFSTLIALKHSLKIVFTHKPDLILCNGPGTCVPVCLAGFLHKVLGLGHCSIVFVESICRVKTLSLTGKIMTLLADSVVVQWPELHEKYPSTVYLGKLI